METSHLQTAIEQFDSRVKQSPLCYPEYLDLEEKAKSCSLYPSLALLERKTLVTVLSSEDILNWKNLAADSQEDYIKLLSLLKEEFPTTETWLNYLDAIEPTEQELLRAFAQCSSDYKRGHEIFTRIRDFYASKDTTDQSETLLQLYVHMLSVPHAQLEETYQDYSKFVTSKKPESYPKLMKSASKLKNQSESSSSYYINFEKRISENPLDPQAWIAYIESCAKYQSESSDFTSIEQLFYRSLIESSKITDASWLPVWKSFLDLVEKHQTSCLRSFQYFFIKCFPQLPAAYVALTRIMDDEVEFTFLRSNLLRLQEAFKNKPEWRTIAKALLLGDFKQFTKVLVTREPTLLDDISTIASTAFEREDSVGILQLAITLARRFSSGEDDYYDLFIELTTATFDRWPHSASVWAMCFRLLALFGNPKYAKRMLKLLPEDIKELDDPNLALESAIAHQAMYGQPEEVQELLDLQEKYSHHEPLLQSKKPITEELKRFKEDEDEEKEVKKLKLDQDTATPSRSREMFRVKVDNLPLSSDKKAVSDFFQGYCEPITIEVFSTVQGSFALVELDSEQDVMKALVRDQKKLGGSVVSVKRIFGNTLWLTNYPSNWGPSELEAFLRSEDLLFLKVRYPSQSDKREKRFCYVDFPDTVATQKAQSTLNEKLVEGHTLKADISNPSLKQKRTGPNPAHQIYVHNINFDVTTEETLRQFFSEVGKVEDVKVPLNQANKENGHKNNGYAFVTFADAKDVKRALEADGSSLDGRTIHVSRGKSKQAMKNPLQFIKNNTIALFNVNSITTKSHLEEFLNRQVGPTTKIFLKPSKKAALVEFEKETDAGKASLKLEGTLFEEEVLQVGTKDDFFKQDGETQPSKKPTTTPTMAPPMLMRRRRR